jgi:hypothetical protein
MSLRLRENLEAAKSHGGMMSFLLVANTGRRDFGWLVCGCGLVSCLMWRRFGVLFGGEVGFLLVVPSTGDGFYTHRLSPFLPFLLFSFPPSSSLRSSQAFFRFTHPPAPFRTISDV